MARQRERLFASAERGRPEVGHETWHQVDVRVGGEAYRLRVAQSRGGRYHVELDGRPVDVDAERTGRFERRLAVGGHDVRRARRRRRARDYLVEVDGAVHRISGGEAGLVRAPAPGDGRGDPGRGRATRSPAGDVVAVVESMKLETALRAPVSGRVPRCSSTSTRRWRAARSCCGWSRTPTTPRSASRRAARRPGRRWPRGTAAARTTPATVAADALAALRSLVLGYDIDEADARALLARSPRPAPDLPADDPAVLGGRARHPAASSPTCRALSRNRRGPEDESQQVDAEAGDARARNPQEYLHAYLRSRDADAEGLPESFRAKLRRALAHYGVRRPGARRRRR